MVYNLAAFGSYTVGGRFLKTEEGEPKVVNFTRDVSYEINPCGTRAVEHAYVQYFVPEKRRDGPTIVLLHGGGMSGSCWETTPDGRPGWLQLLLERGFEVHVIDNMERGRAGFAPNAWAGEPLLRTMDEAWNLFRIGTADGFESRTSFASQKFPTAAFDTFARSFVPRWFSTSAGQSACVKALLEKVGSAIVVCHSQGAQVLFDVLKDDPGLAEAVIALEPSGDPTNAHEQNFPPTLIVAGGHLDSSDFWIGRRDTWRQFGESGYGRLRLLETDEALQVGHSHMLMLDHDNEGVLDACLNALSEMYEGIALTDPRQSHES